MSIGNNVRQIFSCIPAHVELVAAVKTRTAEEILQAVDAGVRCVGENYVQEAERVFSSVGRRVKWHFIGSLQKNKAKKAVALFDMIETIDSEEMAREIDKRCKPLNKIMSVLVEVNSGAEGQKSGVLPKDTLGLVKKMSGFSNLKVEGLMTMGPFSDVPEDSRSYFRLTRQVFEEIKNKDLENIEMKYLSMGMTSSYMVAIEEGANMVRIGTKIFGERAVRAEGI